MERWSFALEETFLLKLSGHYTIGIRQSIKSRIGILIRVFVLERKNVSWHINWLNVA